MMIKTIPLLDGIGGLAPHYDAMLCDLWGVVHNGQNVFPGAGEALARWRDDGKKVLLLSNSPRPGSSVRPQLASFGIEEGDYDHLVTSGDMVRRALLQPSDLSCDVGGGEGPILHIGPPRDLPLFENIPRPVLAVEDIDFASRQDLGDAVIVCTGLLDDESETAEDYRTCLQAAADRGLPMICANPDLTVMRGERAIPCAGALAALYEEIGGLVAYFGKPHAAVYRFSMDLLGLSEPGRLLAIGDSLHTDMAGAAGADIDAVLITGGIHADQFHRPEQGSEPVLDQQVISRACAEASLSPVGAMARLRW